MNAFLDGFASLIDYFVTQWQQILSLTIEHIEMTAIAVGCSIDVYKRQAVAKVTATP